MADSSAETVLQAVLLLLQTALPGVTVERNSVLPTTIPAAGLVILRDGDPGEPEVIMSPITWLYDHAAEVEIITQGEDRDAVFDAIKWAIGAALAADRTLGGICDWVEAAAPAPVTDPVLGADAIKAAVLPLILSYATTDPLG